MSIKCYKKMQESIEEFKQELKEILKKQPKNIIFTDNKSNDTIHAPIYTLDMGELEELQVKGIRYKHNQIEVLVDLTSIAYEKEDVENAPDDEWEPLFGGNVLGWFTAVYIAESIDQYVKMEE